LLQNLNRIFNHGFTTKPGGHGFGLHSSALAAREMGGSLRAQSDGPDRGATFTLELPIQPAEVETHTETPHANDAHLDALATAEPSCAG
jgi:signal transduction histidine kinase